MADAERIRDVLALGLQSQDVPEASMEEVAEILLQRGSRNVLLKLGQRGCFSCAGG